VHVRKVSLVETQGRHSCLMSGVCVAGKWIVVASCLLQCPGYLPIGSLLCSRVQRHLPSYCYICAVCTRLCVTARLVGLFCSIDLPGCSFQALLVQLYKVG